MDDFVEGMYAIRGTMQKSGKYAYYGGKEYWYSGTLRYIKFYYSAELAYDNLLKIVKKGSTVFVDDVNAVSMMRVGWSSCNYDRGDAIDDLELVELTFNHVDFCDKEVLTNHIKQTALSKLTNSEKKVLGLEEV